MIEQAAALPAPHTFDKPQEHKKKEKCRQLPLFSLFSDPQRYKRYLSDYPVHRLTNIWEDTTLSGFGESKSYVVQTLPVVIQRCMLMTTDPGDLVLDPTCGSGTTTYVAEQWGRRWIAIDTSRVPLALARQRLLTATFPYYELKDEARGPIGGFVYKRKQNNKGEAGEYNQIAVKVIDDRGNELVVVKGLKEVE